MRNSKLARLKKLPMDITAKKKRLQYQKTAA